MVCALELDVIDDSLGRSIENGGHVSQNLRFQVLAKLFLEDLKTLQTLVEFAILEKAGSLTETLRQRLRSIWGQRLLLQIGQDRGGGFGSCDDIKDDCRFA